MEVIMLRWRGLVVRYVCLVTLFVFLTRLFYLIMTVPISPIGSTTHGKAFRRNRHHQHDRQYGADLFAFLLFARERAAVSVRDDRERVLLHYVHCSNGFPKTVLKRGEPAVKRKRGEWRFGVGRGRGAF
jgi:hypothetical protein